MKNQALFSLKDKSKKLKCRLLQFLFGALRVKSSVNSFSADQSVSSNKCGEPTYFIMKVDVCTTMFLKGDNVCCLKFVSLDRISVPKRCLLLKERICSKGSKFFPLRVDLHCVYSKGKQFAPREQILSFKS